VHKLGEVLGLAAKTALIIRSDGSEEDVPLFYVPTGLVRILDRDLAAAGIPKRDDRGRTVDVHAMRHTFGTHLSKGGVTPRTAQAAMRHSTLDLTGPPLARRGRCDGRVAVAAARRPTEY
jgi:integrase